MFFQKNPMATFLKRCYNPQPQCLFVVNDVKSNPQPQCFFVVNDVKSKATEVVDTQEARVVCFFSLKRFRIISLAG